MGLEISELVSGSALCSGLDLGVGFGLIYILGLGEWLGLAHVFEGAGLCLRSRQRQFIDYTSDEEAFWKISNLMSTD